MKKFVCALMAMVMVLGCLTACSPAQPNPGEKKTFKFGSIGPLTGDTAIYGIATDRGLQLAIKEINAAGGINGYQAELSSQDDTGDSEISSNAYNNLMDWGMHVLLGPVLTGCAITVSADCFSDRTFMLTGTASSSDVTKGKDNVYQMCFTDPNQGVGSADYIAANMTGHKIAVIYQNDSAYSQGIYDTFAAEAKVKNLEIVYSGTFTKDTATDFSVQLTAAQTAGADLVFLPMYYTEASLIFSQAKNMNYSPIFFGVDGMDGILTMEGFDTSLAEGVYLLTPFDATADSSKKFVDAFKAQFNEVPNQFAADGYDVAYAIKVALEAANCTPDMTAAEICEKLVAVFPTISMNGVTGSNITWKSNGEVNKLPVAVKIQNGAYVSAK